MEYTTEQKIDIIKRILEINDLRSQYSGCRKAPEFVENGRLHFNVEQIGYDGTSRVYTKDFSVNQLSKSMREAVVPDEGKKFLYFDFKSAELYILWYWSKCQEGLSWYNSGLDPHTEVMKRLLGKEEVTKADRAVSKVLSFATCYGGTEKTIANDLNCDLETAAKFQADYNALFPEINQLKAKLVDYAHVNGCTKTLFNRFRKLPNINSYDDGERASCERQAVNTAIQASCADFLKEGTRRIQSRFPQVRIVMQVFDSMLIEVPAEWEEEDIRPILDTACDFNDLFPGFKFRCDWAFGSNWKEAQEAC